MNINAMIYNVPGSAQPPSRPTIDQARAGFGPVLDQLTRPAPAQDNAARATNARVQRDAQDRATASTDQARRAQRDDAQDRSRAADDRREQNAADDRRRERIEERADAAEDRRVQQHQQQRDDTEPAEEFAADDVAATDAQDVSPVSTDAANTADPSAELADAPEVALHAESRSENVAAKNSQAVTQIASTDAQIAAALSQQSGQSGGSATGQGESTATLIDPVQNVSPDATFKLASTAVSNISQGDATAAATQAAAPAGGRIEVQATLATAEPAPPAPLPPTESNSVLGRVARGLHNAIQQNGGTVTMRLNPPELGVLRIELEMHNGTASVRFQTEHTNVRELLNQQLSTLRQGLEGHGVSVERLDVQMAANSSRESHLNQQPDDGRSRGQFSQREGRSSNGSPQGDASRQQPRSFFDEFVDAVA